MGHYVDPDDRAYTRVYKHEAADIFEALDNLDRAVLVTEARQIPLQHRRLAFKLTDHDHA